MKARAIPCSHQPPTRGNITVSAAPGATKQLFRPDRIFKIIIYIYIYTPDQLKADITLSVHGHFTAVCDFF